MTIGCVGLAGLLAGLAAGAEPAPLSWSPNGRWLAYRSADPTPGGTPEPGWIFRATPAERARPLPRLGGSGRPSFRVVTTEPGGGSLTIEASEAPLSIPCWDPLRGDLLYGAASDGGGLRLWRRGFDPKPSPLATLPGGGDAAREAGAILTPSADGRYLAVARPWVPDVLIVRADNGRPLKTLPAATLPAWSRDGSRLAFLSGGANPWLQVVDAGLGPPRMVVGPLAPVAPQWSRDGENVFVVMSRKLPAPAIRGESLELSSVSVSSRASETITRLGLTRIDAQAPPTTASFTLGTDGDDLFYALSPTPGQPSTIVWFRPKTSETVKRYHPLDLLVGIADLSLSPDTRTLAARYGPDGLVGISEPGQGDLNPVVPDEDGRRAWVALLVDTARRLVHLALPPAAHVGRPVERPTILPVPGEVARNAEIASRVRRVARIGLPLCRLGPRDDSPAARFDEESAFFFEYLLDDWAAALRSLDALEARFDAPERRLALLGLRVQVWMGQGERDRAGEALSYLESVDLRSPRRIESTPSGPVLADDPDAPRGWPSYLRTRLDALNAGAAAARRESLGHRNPDNPNDGRMILPFDELQGRLPFSPFRRAQP